MSEGSGFKVLDVNARPRKTCSFANAATETLLGIMDRVACGWGAATNLNSPPDLQTWWQIEACAGGNEVVLYNTHDGLAIQYVGENQQIGMTGDLNRKEAWWTLEQPSAAVKDDTNWKSLLIRSVANPKVVLDLDGGKSANGTRIFTWVQGTELLRNQIWLRREWSSENN